MPPERLTLERFKELVESENPGTHTSDIESLFHKVKPYEKLAYKPVVGDEIPYDVDSDTLVSKYGGKPYISASNPWPRCSEDNCFFFFLFQLRVSDIPKDQLPEGVDIPEGSMIQLFRCCSEDGEDECACDDQEGGHDDQSWVCRMISTTEPPLISSEYPTPSAEFPCKLLLRFEPYYAFPALHSIPEPAPTFSAIEMQMESLEIFNPHGDHVGGYGYWLNLTDLRPCYECDTPSILLYQIVAYENTDYDFGDGGCCQILMCPKHPECVQVVWAM
ncbi:Protein of unknown function DUF1963 like protein [Aduncisulcus paluster]|uniref:Uncharacterized protein n=1 Tax=Aduncisulcus paluster TaxID=2918883 RepID=A0ABQ5KI41_9EUKA|nr:Protein of unknown function DUF1963 like protein [Aduncisulcus paluster]